MAKVYKGAGVQVAKMAGKSPVLDEAAAKIKASAEGLAARHYETGEYSKSFETKAIPGKSGVMDRAVYSNHPAAYAIERGHFAVVRGHYGRFVPGQFNLERAIGGM